MISLKVEHAHPKLPCHPTRSFLEEQASINETDREHLSEENDEQYENTSEAPHQFKLVDSRAVDSISVSQASIGVKKSKPKKRKIQTVEDVYHADVIEEAFQGSIKILPINIRQLIMQRQKLMEDKVYHGVLDDNSNLLGKLYDNIIDGETHFKDQVKENLMELMGDIQSKFETEIRYSDKYVIHKIVRSTKDDILSNRKSKYRDTSSLTFNSRTNNEEQSVASDSVTPSYEEFNLKSEKTKKADEFIRKIQREQEEMRKKRKEQEDRKRSLEVRSMEEKKEFEEEIKSERRNYLKRRIEAKQEMKEKEMEVREKMNKQYKEFLKKYKKKVPLFKKNEQEYQLLEQEERDKKEHFLSRLREERKPMSLKEILEHEQKYREIKMEKEEEKSNEKKMRDSLHPPINYYKSKCHEELLKEQEKEKERVAKQDPKLIRSELIKKRGRYAEQVRKQFVPKTDDFKQKQLKRLMEKLQWSQELQKRKKDDRDSYVQGNQNLQKLHEEIKVLKEQGKLPLVNQTISHEEPIPKKHYKNYLQNVGHRKSYSTLEYERVAEKDMEEVGLRAKKAEQNARRREVYIKSGNFDVEKSLKEGRKIDEDYLESIKAKMAMLNKIQ